MGDWLPRFRFLLYAAGIVALFWILRPERSAGAGPSLGWELEAGAALLVALLVGGVAALVAELVYRRRR